MQWLGYYQLSTLDTSEPSWFAIHDYELLQVAFAEVEAWDEQGKFTNDISCAYDWCEQLIITRFMQLVHSAHQQANKQGLAWAKLPVYCSEQGYNFVVCSKV